jgi:hypothetical protein
LYENSAKILQNYFENCSTGIDLDSRESVDFFGNSFRKTKKSMILNAEKNVFLINNEFSEDSLSVFLGKNNSEIFLGANRFSGSKKLLETDDFKQVSRDSTRIFENIEAETRDFFLEKVKFQNFSSPEFAGLKPLPDGIDAKAGVERKRAKNWLILTDSGPFDFKGPNISLRKIEGNSWEFWVQAASPGNWEVKKAVGFKKLTMTGGFPCKLIAERNPAVATVILELEGVFQKEQTDFFGRKIAPETSYIFKFKN